MGLDITAYSKITLLDAVFDADGEPIDPATRQPITGDYTRAWVTSEFPGRADDIIHRGVYAYDESLGVRAGSYSGYNRWRENLAELAGYPAVPYERVPGYSPSIAHRHDAGCWRSDGGPFYELICFSDCEGVLGTDTCRKLLGDFDEYDSKAATYTGDSTYFYEKYREWRAAMALAADGGMISFH